MIEVIMINLAVSQSYRYCKLKLGEEYLNSLKGVLMKLGRAVNSSKMVNRINNALKLFNLELHIELTELRTWSRPNLDFTIQK